MQLMIQHETRYEYEEPVSYSIQSLRLTPRPEAGQRVLSWRITSPGQRIEQVDAYGNLTTSTALVTLARQTGPLNAFTTVTQAAIGGQVTFAQMMLTLPGTYKLKASTPGLGITSSTVFTIV